MWILRRGFQCLSHSEIMPRKFYCLSFLDQDIFARLSGNEGIGGAVPPKMNLRYWLPEGSVLRWECFNQVLSTTSFLWRTIMCLCSFEESITGAYQQIGGILHVRVVLHFLLLDIYKSLH